MNKILDNSLYISRRGNDGIMFTGASICLINDKRNNNNGILEVYKRDIYTLFLAKLNDFMISSVVGDEDVNRLKSLLDEIIKVQSLLEDPNNEHRK